MKCNYCNLEINDTDTYCPFCGKQNVQQIEVKYCTICGHKFIKGDKFCRVCGTKKASSKKLVTPKKIEILKEDVIQPVVERQDVKQETVKEEEIVQEETKIENAISNSEMQEIDEIFSEKTFLPSNKIEEPVNHSEQEVSQSNTIEEEKYYDHTTLPTSQVEQEVNHFKNPIIWIISLALLIVSTILNIYVQQHFNNSTIGATERSFRRNESQRDQIANSDIEDFVITEGNTQFMQQSNINMHGYSFFYNEVFYLATVDGIMAYSNDFLEQETIVNRNASFIHVDDTFIYYTNEYSDYYRMHLETEKEEKLLSNIYYPQHVDGKIYYQDDEDGESIYSYHLETEEITKLNAIRSFELFIDTEKNSIYYLGYEDYKYGIYRMDLDGQNNQLLIDDIYPTINYDGTYLYYHRDDSIIIHDVSNGEETEIIKEDVYEILLVGDTIVSWDSHVGPVRYVDKEGTSNFILNEDVYFIQVIGEYIICWIHDGNYASVYILDIDGNCAFLVNDFEINNDIDDNDNDKNIFEL